MKISRQKYNTSQMTDMNSLSKALMTKPSVISPVITHLGGKIDRRFPLSMMTEGVGSTKSIDSLEYEYNVKQAVRYTRPIAETPSNTTNLGKGGQPFTLTFPDKWFIKDYVLVGKSGAQVRIMNEPVPNGSGNYDYTVQLVDPDPNAYLPAGDVTAGSHFAQMFAPVGVDFSRGNASNWEAPAKIRHKLTTLRKSYQMSGNAVDQVVAIDLPTANGTTRYWMEYEEWNHMMEWKAEFERYLWYGKQSYGENGHVSLRDENNQPIVIGPGLFEQVVNKDTFSVLTASKLENTVGDLFYGMSDGQNRQVTLYTGTGGQRDFDRAMKDLLGEANYTILDNGKFISGSGRGMTLGGYFTSYRHIDGHLINVVKNPLFDRGPVAQARAKHPRTGFSLESHRMVFVDQSNYDGQNNLQMINKKNREQLRWAVAGSTIPRGMSGNDLRASDVDGASVHFLKTAGVLLRRFDTSLDLQCVAS